MLYSLVVGNTPNSESNEKSAFFNMTIGADFQPMCRATASRCVIITDEAMAKTSSCSACQPTFVFSRIAAAEVLSTINSDVIKNGNPFLKLQQSEDVYRPFCTRQARIGDIIPVCDALPDVFDVVFTTNRAPVKILAIDPAPTKFCFECDKNKKS